jgi:hypothetical protein
VNNPLSILTIANTNVEDASHERPVTRDLIINTPSDIENVHSRDLSPEFFNAGQQSSVKKKLGPQFSNPGVTDGRKLSEQQRVVNQVYSIPHREESRFEVQRGAEFQPKVV